jgi:hypothetical protein
MIFRRRKQARRLTGARAILKADHRDQITGEVHSHEWEIIAWWPYNGTSAEVRRSELDTQIKYLEGRCLPDSIAWAENLAAHIGHAINSEYACYGGYGSCCRVEIARDKERLYARWKA